MSVSLGAITFIPSETAYVMMVAKGTTSVTVTATLPQPLRATMTVNGNAASSGVAVTVGRMGASSTVSIVVTAESGASRNYTVRVVEPPTYLKPSNPGTELAFGVGLAISADGNTIAVGAGRENGGSGGINGNELDTTVTLSGAVYVFVRSGATWVQQAYIKGAQPSAHALFGESLALSSDGNTLAVGAHWTYALFPMSTVSYSRGEVFIFVRTGNTWSQQASFADPLSLYTGYFGNSVALSADGNTLAVGAPTDMTSGVGINAPPGVGIVHQSGAVFVFVRLGATWTHEAFIKSSNSGSNDHFGCAVALSADGNVMAAGALGESSDDDGIDGNQADNSAPVAGAVYVFTRMGSVWSQQAYLKAPGSTTWDRFGRDVALSASGTTLAATAPLRAGGGFAVIFVKGANAWTRQAVLTGKNVDSGDSDHYSYIAGDDTHSLSLSADGNTLAYGTSGEDSAATGLNGNSADNTALNAGATHVFTRTGTAWSHRIYLKASNTDANDRFGTAVVLTPDGRTLVVTAASEKSSAVGVDGNQADNTATFRGAAYVFEL